LGVAILYRRLLQALTRDISRATGGRPVRRPRGQSLAGTLRAALRPTTECPACAHVKGIEDIAIRACRTARDHWRHGQARRPETRLPLHQGRADTGTGSVMDMAIEMLVGADPLADRGPACPWVRW